MAIVIGNKEILYRRFPIGNPNFVKPNGDLSSFVFTPSSGDKDGLSVNIASLASQEESVIDNNRFGLTQIEAGDVRSVDNLDCQHDPKVDNYAHALIIGDISKAKSRKLTSLSKRIL